MKSKIVNQILNSIIEIKFIKNQTFLLKNLQNQLLENLSLLFFMKSSKVPRQIIELLMIGLICFAIYFSSNLGTNIQVVISLILLYFFAAIRIYPSVNNIIMTKLALVQGEISIKEICNDIENANQYSETVGSDNENLNLKI